MSEPYMITLFGRDKWLKARKNHIGSSEAAALVGLSPWINNVDLWKIKTGRAEAKDVDNDALRYGAAAEEHLRALYVLDHPETDVKYEPNNMWLYDDYPFAHASLDGWLFDRNGRLGVLEIKTVTAAGGLQWRKWGERIPDSHYCQACWCMMVTGAEFVDLRAMIKGRAATTIKDYHIERSEAAEDIATLAEAGEQFWQYVQAETAPPLVLPNV